METKLSKLKAFKHVTLTTDERSLMRAHAARIIMSTPVLVTESFFKRGVQQGLRIALSSMLFIVFIAGSVSAVASNALPGDPLYSFKINVNEKVKGLIVGADPATRTAVNANRVIARLNEVQTLADSNSLTPEKQEIAAKAISNQVADFSATVSTLSDQSPSNALAVTTSLEQTLKANKVALEGAPATTPAQVDSKAAAINTVNTTLQTVSNQAVQILSKEIDTIGTAVNTVPTSASDAASVSTSTDASTNQTPTTPPEKVTPVAP